MKLARVVGNVVSTINHADFDVRTLPLCDLLNPDGTLTGGYQIVVGIVDAVE